MTNLSHCPSRLLAIVSAFKPSTTQTLCSRTAAAYQNNLKAARLRHLNTTTSSNSNNCTFSTPLTTTTTTPISAPRRRPVHLLNYPRHRVAAAPKTPRHYITTMASATTFFDFKPKDKKGNEYPLESLKGKVVLVVNTASKCGFTPQFAGLEKLYQDLKKEHPDFLILGFPCNQFGSQDPGSNDEIQSFCQVNYGVTFPVLGKVDVNGDAADPVFEWLKTEKPGLMGLKRVKWNFEKFLVGRDGKVVGRWASTTKPETLRADIEKALAQK